MAKKLSAGAKRSTLQVSTLRGLVKPILIEVWNDKGRKSCIRTDNAGARHVAAVLLKHATDLERSADESAGMERVRRDD